VWTVVWWLIGGSLAWMVLQAVAIFVLTPFFRLFCALADASDRKQARRDQKAYDLFIARESSRR
jgi:hypothetical protein